MRLICLTDLSRSEANHMGSTTPLFVLRHVLLGLLNRSFAMYTAYHSSDCSRDGLAASSGRHGSDGGKEKLIRQAGNWRHNDSH